MKEFADENLNSLPNSKIFDYNKSEAFADNKLNIAKMTISDRVEKIVGKCWLPEFSPVPTMF